MNGSNDYRDRLIYLSCNNYVTLKEVLTKSCPDHDISSVNDVENFDLFFWLNMRKFMSCAFQSMRCCADHAFVPCQGLPATTSFINDVFIMILLRAGSIP